MQKRNFTQRGHSPSQSRFARPQSRFGSGAGRPSPYKGRYQKPQSKKGGFSERITFSRFVNKAAPVEETVVFTPKHSFADFAILENLKKAILARGYKTPTPIQDEAIPKVLLGHDVLGIANTGTGKTGAFLIPLLNSVLENPRKRVLIMVPTRELAIQIDNELKGLTKGAMKIFSVCCVGGARIGNQIRDLRYFNHFIIGTPGRLKDLIERKLIPLNEISTVVLDEADRMLDMGFIADMRFIVAATPKDRQTLFFSATLSRDIEKLIGDFLKNPVRVSVKTRDTVASVDQDVVRVHRGEDKVDVLHNLLTNKEFSKVLVFGKTKHGVENLSHALAKRGIPSDSIHGNKNHTQRQRALGRFKDNQVQVLVATDVAARGLDIVGVSHVINYDLPATYDDYIHRIGRTGRAGKTGKALTFIPHHEK